MPRPMLPKNAKVTLCSTRLLFFQIPPTEPPFVLRMLLGCCTLPCIPGQRRSGCTTCFTSSMERTFGDECLDLGQQAEHVVIAAQEHTLLVLPEIPFSDLAADALNEFPGACVELDTIDKHLVEGVVDASEVAEGRPLDVNELVVGWRGAPKDIGWNGEPTGVFEHSEGEVRVAVLVVKRAHEMGEEVGVDFGCQEVRGGDV